MKILITAPIFPPVIGGPATYVWEICRRWKNIQQIAVVCFGDEIEEIKGVKIVPIRVSYRFLGTWKRQFRLFFNIWRESKNVDVIYAQGPDIVGLMSFLVALLRGKKIVVKYVGDLAWETAFGNGKTQKFLDNFLAKPDTGIKDRIIIWLQKLVFQGVTKIVVPSEYLKSVIERYYFVNADKIEVIYNGIDLEAFESFQSLKKAKSDNVVKIVTVGRLVNWKNIRGIIEAINLLKEKMPIKLSIIGDGPERNYLTDLARQSGLEEEVIFEGRLSHEATLEKIGRGDIFVLNSYYEGLPHTVIEAMMLGIPVVATDIPGTREIAIDQKTALLVPVNDSQILAKQIELLAADELLRQSLIKEARKLVEKQFSFELHLKKLAEIL